MKQEFPTAAVTGAANVQQHRMGAVIGERDILRRQQPAILAGGILPLHWPEVGNVLVIE